MDGSETHHLQLFVGLAGNGNGDVVQRRQQKHDDPKYRPGNETESDRVEQTHPWIGWPGRRWWRWWRWRWTAAAELGRTARTCGRGLFRSGRRLVGSPRTCIAHNQPPVL